MNKLSFIHNYESVLTLDSSWDFEQKSVKILPLRK